MKTTLYTIFMFLCVAIECVAEPVSHDAARQVATAFLKGKGATVTGDAVLAPGSSARAANRQAPAEMTPYYVFNATAGKGYVIVSGDDCVGDNLVLGYTEKGNFDAKSVPDNLQWWLDQTASQITALSQRGAKATAVAVHDDIPYLIKSLWGQGDDIYNPKNPYNAFCPDVDGKLCAAGCMATALAQIMYYHRWPKETIGELPAYETFDGRVFDALPQTSFDWDNMVDDYTQPTTKEQQDAVALLMRYCGQMMQMDYAPSGSSALQYDRDMLVNHFGYDQNMYYAYAAGYTLSEWDNMLYNELKEGRPVAYAGYSNFNGHAFVLDGYAVMDGSGYYHVNWGWLGEENGYYKIDLLNPGRKEYKKHDFSYDGYTVWQDAIIGLKPAENPPSNYGRYLVHYLFAPNMGGSPLFEALNPSYNPGIFDVAMAELKEDGTPDYNNLVGHHTVEVLGFNYANYSIEGDGLTLIEIPEGVAEGMAPGSHKMVFVNREAETDAAWRTIFGTHCCVEFVIGDDGLPKDTLYHPMPQLTCKEGSLQIEGLFQDGMRLTGSATIINDSDEDYTDYLDCEAYIVEDGILVDAAAYKRASIMVEGNGTSDIRFDFSVPWAGDYIFIISRNEGDLSGLSLDELVALDGYITHTAFSIDELAFYCQKLDYEERPDENEQPAYYIDAVLENNTPLYYDAAIKAGIFTFDGEDLGEPLDFCTDSLLSVPFKLASDEQKKVSIKLPRKLEAGGYEIGLYLSYDFNSVKEDKDYYCFADYIIIVPEPTGIKDVQGKYDVRGKKGDGKIYNLNGQQVTDDYKGFVIKDGKKYRN